MSFCKLCKERDTILRRRLTELISRYASLLRWCWHSDVFWSLCYSGFKLLSAVKHSSSKLCVFGNSRSWGLPLGLQPSCFWLYGLYWVWSNHINMPLSSLHPTWSQSVSKKPWMISNIKRRWRKCSTCKVCTKLSFITFELFSYLE